MSKPYYDDGTVTIYHADCREVLSRLSVDVTITDPPYNVGKNYGTHDDAMELEAYVGWLGGIMAALRTSELVYFPGTRNVWDAPRVCGEAWRIHRMLGWHRREFAGDKWVGGPAMSWEPIVWASRADRPAYNVIHGTYGRDFLVVPATHGDPDRPAHPCPKPLPVMTWLVGLFVPLGGTVLDPFAGTGRTLVAAKNLGRRAIGIEIEERYCEMAAKRLAQEVLPLGDA